MLRLDIPDKELFNNQTETFYNVKGGTFYFEHSLFAVAKWESETCKPFLVQDRKSEDEWMLYFKCMCTSKNLDLRLIGSTESQKILNYISSSRTATRISKHDSDRPSGTYVSSELMYANMAQTGVPFEADKWNLSRLTSLLAIIAEQNTPKDKRKKLSANEVASYQADLNAKRRAELNSKG